MRIPLRHAESLACKWASPGLRRDHKAPSTPRNRAGSSQAHLEPDPIPCVDRSGARTQSCRCVAGWQPRPSLSKNARSQVPQLVDGGLDRRVEAVNVTALTGRSSDVSKPVSLGAAKRLLVGQ